MRYVVVSSRFSGQRAPSARGYYPVPTVERALTGECGVLRRPTKRLLESALDGFPDHPGCDKHDPAGNSSNSSRAKTAAACEQIQHPLRCSAADEVRRI